MIILVTVSVQLQKLNKFGGFINKKLHFKSLIYTETAHYTSKRDVNFGLNSRATDLTFISMPTQVLRNCNKNPEKVEF